VKVLSTNTPAIRSAHSSRDSDYLPNPPLTERAWANAIMHLFRGIQALPPDVTLHSSRPWSFPPCRFPSVLQEFLLLRVSSFLFWPPAGRSARVHCVHPNILIPGRRVSPSDLEACLLLPALFAPIQFGILKGTRPPCRSAISTVPPFAFAFTRDL